ncbi:MAG: hypothetical protein QW520_01555 [Methanomassiliicoccales archaeon]
MLRRVAQSAVHNLCRTRPERRILAIFIVWAIIFGGLMALDVLFIRDFIDSELWPVTDISYYRYRTQAILDGQWLYCDIPCESPPLIVYFMIPAQLANGGYLAYQLLFSLFCLLTAITLYWALKSYDDDKAFMAGVAFLLVPVGVVETVVGIQDEPIVVWLFLLSILLGVKRKMRWSALATAVGIWTKLINSLYYPFLFRDAVGFKERVLHIGIICAFSLAVAVPYMIVCPWEFLRFPLFYLFSSGPDVGATGGLSIWDFLEMGGIRLPGPFFLILTVSILILAYFIAFKRKMSTLKGMLLVLTVFTVIYSRSAAGYFMLPISLLLLWGVEDRQIMIRCGIIYLPLITSALFSRSNPSGAPYLEVEYGWVIGAILQLITLCLLIDATRRALGTENFVDRRIRVEAVK